MKSTKSSIISLIVLFIGWFFIGISYGEVVVEPLKSIFYFGGVALFFGGLMATVYLIFK
ncbi:hypothetical protein [Reichenbachiella faecimaris]|uniref:hypothetical protein n=1 Tax=Reichenbachiella faecimaris TaxID=692418 RepID=UPI0015933B7A|nr:hypothetical protein [Reichenbachiella faecimaris]